MPRSTRKEGGGGSLSEYSLDELEGAEGPKEPGVKPFKLSVARVELDEANAFVEKFHRHHKPLHRVRFSVGVQDQYGRLRGVAMCGRPVARKVNQKMVLEVSRVATDGCPNACSFLYGLVARIAKFHGFQKVQTYILAEEPGTSLKAAGWKWEANVKGESWTRRGSFDGETRRTDQPNGDKSRWAVSFGNEVGSEP